MLVVIQPECRGFAIGGHGARRIGQAIRRAERVVQGVAEVDGEDRSRGLGRLGGREDLWSEPAAR
jgi:hypothetical protein